MADDEGDFDGSPGAEAGLVDAGDGAVRVTAGAAATAGEDGDGAEKKKETEEERWKQCALEAVQVEEMFMRRPIQDRQLLCTYVAECPVNTRTHDPDEDGLAFALVPRQTEGRPETWHVRTLDTCRFVPFTWTKLVCRLVPQAVNEESLFRQAMRAFDEVGMYLAVALSHYEAAEHGFVFVCNLPLACMTEFVTSHVRQDDLELGPLFGDDGEPTPPPEAPRLLDNVSEEAHNAVHAEILRLKAFWAKRDAGLPLYQDFARSVYHHRATYDPPLLLFYSAIDRDFVVVLCRDTEYTPWVEYVSGLPFVRDRQVLTWPIREHSREADPPARFCARPSCARYAGPPTADDGRPHALVTYARHTGPREREREEEFGRHMRALWRDEYAPKIDEEYQRLVADEGEILDADDLATMRGDIEREYAAVAEAREADERAAFGDVVERLRRCGSCRRVGYCSKECQTQDWGRHKAVCFKPAAAATTTASSDIAGPSSTAGDATSDASETNRVGEGGGDDAGNSP